MPRGSEPQSRIHLLLPDRDIERLRSVFGRSMTLSVAVRLIIRSYLNKLDAKADKAAHHHLSADVARVIDETQAQESLNAGTQVEPPR